MQELRSNTTTIVTVGPFVDITDGLTPETGVVLGNCDEAEFVSSNTDVTTDISGFTWSAITSVDGYYALHLTDDCLAYPGPATVAINSDGTSLSVRNNFMVLGEYEWDRKYLNTGVNSGKLSGVQWYGTFGAIDDTTIALAAGHGLTGGRVLVVLTGGTNAVGKSRIGTLATNTVTVDPTWVSDSETRPSGTITGYATSIPKTPTSSIPGVNMLQISGDGPAADNLELAFDGTGYNASKLTVGGVVDISTLTVAGVTNSSAWTVAGVTNSSAWTIAGDVNSAALINALNDIDGASVTLGDSAITIAGITNSSAWTIAGVTNIGSLVSVHPTSTVSSRLLYVIDSQLTGDGNTTPFNVVTE